MKNLEAGKIFKVQGVDKETREQRDATAEELEATKMFSTYKGWELDDMNLDEKLTEMLKNYSKLHV